MRSRLFRADRWGTRRALAWSIALLVVVGAFTAWQSGPSSVEVTATDAPPARRISAEPAPPDPLPTPTTTTTTSEAPSPSTTTSAVAAPLVSTPTTVAPRRTPPPPTTPNTTSTTAPPAKEGTTTPYTVTSGCRGIHVLELGSGRVTSVSGAPRAAFGPRFSPSGASIAWTESQARVLYAGSDLVVRTAAPTGANSEATWAADSRRLVWSRYTGSRFEAVVTDVDSGNEQVVGNTVRMRSLFAASPTGDHIAYGGGDQDGIRIARIDGTSDVAVPGAPESRTPVWSPGGTSLAYVDGTGIAAYELATGATRRLFTGPVEGGFAFAGEARLLVSTASGLQVVDLGDGSVVANLNGGGKPVWDVARQRVIFRRPANQPSAEILEAALDGSQERRLFVERDAQVLGLDPSPLGDRIAFHCQIPGSA